MPVLARYERKYLTSQNHADLANCVLLHPQFFHEIFHARQVCSLYFDTPRYTHYADNVLGAAYRKKIRVRWYREVGTNWFEQPHDLQLEIKQRTGDTLHKTVFEMDKVLKKSDHWMTDLTTMITETLTPLLEHGATLQPVLFNTYERRYFFSELASHRITIDHALRFATPEDWIRNHTTRVIPHTVLECKYAPTDDRHLDTVVQHLPLRISKSSKYVMGMNQCYPSLHI